MSPAKLSRREARMAQIAVAVAELEERGICWDAWARERGLPRQAVINARKGDRPCWTGESRRAADLILAEARRPGSTESTHFTGFHPPKGEIPTRSLTIKGRETHTVLVETYSAQVILPSAGQSARIRFFTGESEVDLVLDAEKGWQVVCEDRGFTLGTDLTPAGFCMALGPLGVLDPYELTFEPLDSGGIGLIFRLKAAQEDGTQEDPT